MNHITISATLTELDVVLDFITERAAQAGMGAKPIAECALAAEEIFVNIANYAYTPENGDVTVGIETGVGCLSIEIADRGRPFNPLSKKDPDITLDASERTPGGLGIFMVKQLMDEVAYEYRDGQNILKMRKKMMQNSR